MKLYWGISFVINCVLALIFLALIVAATSCSPTRRMTVIAAKHPIAAATVCSSLYPIKENTRVEIHTTIDTVHLPGEVIVVDCDSARMRRTVGDTARMLVNVPCPPAQLITRMVTKDSIVTVENTAKIQALTGELNSVKMDAQKAKDRAKLLLKIVLILGGYLLIKTALRLAMPAISPFLKQLI